MKNTVPVVVTELVLTAPPVYSTLACQDVWFNDWQDKSEIGSQNIQARNKTQKKSPQTLLVAWKDSEISLLDAPCFPAMSFILNLWKIRD